MVYNERGIPIARATVSVGEKCTVTDIRGRFALPEVARGAVELQVTAENHTPLSTTMVFANRAQALHLRLRHGGGSVSCGANT